MDKEVVTELIQENFNKKRIKVELSKLFEPKNRQEIIRNYEILEKKLGGIGASKKTADLIINDLQ
jgi:lipid-A-disaccharide synthase